jgi:hypothetical protein
LVRDNYLAVLRTDSILADPTATGTATTSEILAKGMINLVTPRSSFIVNVSDRRVLNDSIISALKLYDNTATGTLKGQVASFSKITFNTAIISAKGKRDAPGTIDTDVTASILNLNNAKATFIKAIVK